MSSLATVISMEGSTGSVQDTSKENITSTKTKNLHLVRKININNPNNSEQNISSGCDSALVACV